MKPFVSKPHAPASIKTVWICIHCVSVCVLISYSVLIVDLNNFCGMGLFLAFEAITSFFAGWKPNDCLLLNLVPTDDFAPKFEAMENALSMVLGLYTKLIQVEKFSKNSRDNKDRFKTGEWCDWAMHSLLDAYEAKWNHWNRETLGSETGRKYFHMYPIVVVEWSPWKHLRNARTRLKRSGFSL